MELNSVLFPAFCVVKMAGISTSVLFYAFSKLNILTKLSANDVKFTSVDRQKLDLLKYIYVWYRKFYICRDTAQFYEHKNDPRTYIVFEVKKVFNRVILVKILFYQRVFCFLSVPLNAVLGML